MIDGGLRQLFRKGLPKFHWQSVESPFTGKGIPDSNYCFNSVEGWVEHKRAEGTRVKFKVEQIGWHLRRARAGGRTFIAVRKRTGKIDDLYLYRGRDIKDVVANGILAKPLFKTSGGFAGWDWAKIERLLAT